MEALRAQLGDDVDVAAVVERARALGVLGWVRPTGELHAEGPADALRTLVGEDVAVSPVRVEGHEQFAVRGVAAGEFVVYSRGGRFELQLEVAGGRRAWSLPREPSMDPAVKRFAGELRAPGSPGEVWDRGPYEQGGRVAWPEALERGHAVFVLHGERLRGGFALQRTRPGQWLLIKRREPAQPKNVS